MRRARLPGGPSTLLRRGGAVGITGLLRLALVGPAPVAVRGRGKLIAYLLFVSLVFAPYATANSPVISVSVTGVAGDNGWYRGAVQVDWTVTDGTAVPGTCIDVIFPSDTAGTATQVCQATNGTGSALDTVGPFKIDSTPPAIAGGAPTRGPDSSGWYNHAVALGFTGSDSLSGIAFCAGSYGGPDSASATGSGTCRDLAGNQTSASSPGFKYDATPPAIAGGSAARAPDANGWYNHPVVVNFTATDNLSGLAGCTPVTYAGPDGASAGVPSNCQDVAGNGSTGSTSLNYDATGPSVSGSPDRSADANGWYVRPVSVSFGGSDATSGIRACSSGTTYSGPEGRGQAAGSCTDNAGNTGSGAVEVPYDATPPEVTGVAADRLPDANGWYNHALSLAFQGADAGSGIATCTTASYAGPDAAAAAVSGTCTDKAGHASAPRQHRFKYDATPPSLSGVVAQVGNKFALLKWKLSTDVVSVRVTRTPGRGEEASTVIYSGKADFFKDSGIDNRATYEYRVSASDEAANSTPEEKATAVPLPPLFSPSAGARVRAPIVLEWLAVPNATFYNVQVWCLKRKILTAWPKRPRLVVPRAGKFAGNAYTLPRAACKWYVWPGYGRLAERRYGRLAGLSTFVHMR